MPGRPALKLVQLLPLDPDELEIASTGRFMPIPEENDGVLVVEVFDRFCKRRNEYFG